MALATMLMGAIAASGGRDVVASGPALSRMACESPEPPRRLPVRLHLVDRAGLGEVARTVLMAESLRPWRAAGVAVEWGDALPVAAPRPGHDALYVILLPDDGADPARRQSMASIRFAGGRPTTHVTVHAGYVARRIAALRVDDRTLAELPRHLRDRALGRVLGRAVAHEVGHFLLGSAAHTPTGLMRASHRIEHLLAGPETRFAVVLPATPACLVAQAARR